MNRVTFPEVCKEPLSPLLVVNGRNSPNNLFSVLKLSQVLLQGLMVKNFGKSSVIRFNLRSSVLFTEFVFSSYIISSASSRDNGKEFL